LCSQLSSKSASLARLFGTAWHPHYQLENYQQRARIFHHKMLIHMQKAICAKVEAITC
jgi:hypothetical protein